ncbi:MAG TPA: 50S ribosomal protein L18 [Patescibacteria group bacterium]|nr:50S ribosomal protein L18 [Patescibacteria group bacterium]
MTKITKQQTRARRQRRVRARVTGIAQKPRLNVFRSLDKIYAQLVDDESSKTLVSISSLKPIKGEAGERKGKVAESYLVGKTLAEKAKEKGISKVVFDRAGYRYHGRVKAVAEGAREGGLQF